MANKTIIQGLPRHMPEVPQHLDNATRHFLSSLRETVLGLRGQLAPPTVPTNLKVTPISFGNLVQWTRSVNADWFEVLWNTVPDLATAQIVPVGDAAQWTDNIGKNGILRYYWVRAARNNGYRSNPSAPLSGTSLASGTAVTPPPPPPPYQGGQRNQAGTGGQGPGGTRYQGGARNELE
jgi:hypothetical protein